MRSLLVGVVLASSACWDTIQPEPEPVNVTVDLAQRLQRIDGFGASSAWTGGNISDTLAEELYSITDGVGLSLLRIQIRPGGTTNEMRTAQKAAAYGVQVWAAPWSPPAEWKTNGNVKDGGSLLPEHRQDWASSLAAFAKTMSDAGVPLVALSAQNEPNFATPEWETCVYSPSELVTFVRDFLGPALAAQGLATQVMAPESANWDSFGNFASAFATDPAAMQFVVPFATHAYGAGGPRMIGAVASTGKPVWQTEVSDPKTPFDAGMGSALNVAKMIHDNLVVGGVSAWHYWWINPGSMTNRDNAGLTGMGQLTRRAWVMGNWSRFVRPGFVRVAAEPSTPVTSVLVTAFTKPEGGPMVIVAINANKIDIPQPFTIAGAGITEVTPWVTSETSTLAAQAPVPVTDGAFTVTLPAFSVTTFVSS